MTASRKILFYDGDCGFCNRTVAYVLKNDKSGVVHFTALQSEFTRDLFEERGWEQPDLSTVYFLDEELYSKSTAALHIARYLKFPHRLLVVFWIVPRFIRDGVYNWIAKRRRKISKGYCVIPSPEQQQRFI